MQIDKINAKDLNVQSVEIKEMGYVHEIRTVIAKVRGLPSCINGQLINFPDNKKGLVVGFTQEDIQVLALDDTTQIKAGDSVTSKIEPFKIPVGDEFLGRVVNSMAEPFDNREPIKPSTYYPIFREAPGIIDRIPLTETFHTGVKSIDLTIPIAKGQRELIIGDRMTGKTAICADAIINQVGKKVFCIYCCIGRNYSSLLKVVQLLREKNALDYTIIVDASASVPPGQQYIAPYTACALAEYFMDTGRDVFVVFDDLTRHAWIHRQLSLLMGRSPGREAYPGDIFYTHSSLMERAGKLIPEKGGGSITFFPIVETQQGDVAGFIPSNLVSMTDGQIYLSTALFNEGFRPAVDFGLSVSRIGNKAQCAAIKDVSKGLKLDYIQFRELIGLTKMKAKLSQEAEAKVKRGLALTQLFIQDKSKPVTMAEQIITFYAFWRGVLEILPEDAIKKFKNKMFPFIETNFPALVSDLEKGQPLTKEVKLKMKDALMAFFKDERII